MCHLPSSDATRDTLGGRWNAGAAALLSPACSHRRPMIRSFPLPFSDTEAPFVTRFRSILVTLVVMGSAWTAIPAWADEGGTAKHVQGAVRVEPDGASLPLRVGDRLQEKDRVVVPAGGAAGITLRDDTRISLGSGATLVLNQFKFDPQTQEGTVETSILSGAMRYVTGLVGRHRHDAVRVRTATTTVGIRGTDFIVEVGDDR